MIVPSLPAMISLIANLISSADGRRERRNAHSLPRVSFCLGPYPHNGHNGHFKNKRQKPPMKRRAAKLVSVSNIRDKPDGAGHLVIRSRTQPYLRSAPAWRSRAGASA